MATSPHSIENPFTTFIKLERRLASGPDVSHMVYASPDLIPGPLQTEAYWRARVAHVPELSARGETWATAIWHERQERAARVATAPSIVAHYYIGVAALNHVIEICRPPDAIAQLGVLRAVIGKPNTHLHLSHEGVPHDFYGQYRFGGYGEPGEWPHGVWYERSVNGANYADPAKDPDTARYYADTVKKMSDGLAHREDGSANLLDISAQGANADRWVRWQPELSKYLTATKAP